MVAAVGIGSSPATRDGWGGPGAFLLPSGAFPAGGPDVVGSHGRKITFLSNRHLI